MEIQGKVFIVLSEYLEYFEGHEDDDLIPAFKVGDRVIALTNGVPYIWCVRESDFNGSYNLEDYPDDKVDVLLYRTPIISPNDMYLAEEES